MPAKQKNAPPIITLLTDFGDTDGYTGAMKGVILSHCPSASIIDITHNIRAFDIPSAAFVLSTYCHHFPEGTIHIAVVDPGVGSERKPIALKHRGRWFIAPDNGILTFALLENAKFTAREISSAFTSGWSVSDTFHGRDIFAPAAAHLASRRPHSALGPIVKNIVTLDGSQPETTKSGATGKVIHIDSFGNLITNIRRAHIAPAAAQLVITRIAGLSIIGLSKTYSDKKPGELVAYIGSSGYLEIGVVKGAASSAVRTPAGRQVNVFFKTNNANDNK